MNTFPILNRGNPSPSSAEWIRVFSSIEFSSVPEFLKFLKKIDVSSNTMEFDEVRGVNTPQFFNLFSCHQDEGRVRLTRYGITLLRRATDENLMLVKRHLPPPTRELRVDVGSGVSPSPSLAQLAKVFSGILLPRFGDALDHELKLAASVRERLVTTNLSEFTQHFYRLVGDLREGVPFVDREQGGDVAPGTRLKLYLLSFVQDAAKCKSRADPSTDGMLSVFESARCIEDETRTKKFLNAVRGIITQRSYPGRIEPILGIDAGCGSVPIQAIQAAVLHPCVSVTALELNPASAEMARQIVSALGLEKQISVVEGDATTYCPPSPVDFIVSETLQAGLGGEPVVQIFQNLAPHLRETGALLPEKVLIRCGLVPLSDLSNPARQIRTGGRGTEPFPFSAPKWEAQLHHQCGTPLERITFKFRPARPVREPSLVCVEIDVGLGGQNVLRSNESLITMFRSVLNVQSLAPHEPFLISAGRPEICVSYLPGGVPRGVVLER